LKIVFAKSLIVLLCTVS